MQLVDHEILSRCLFNESNDAFIIFDPDDSLVLDVNPTTIRLTGFRRKQLLSLRVMDLLEGAQPAATKETTAKTMKPRMLPLPRLVIRIGTKPWPRR